MADKISDDELVGLVKSPGWELVADKNDKATTGTLEDVLKVHHQMHRSGETPGPIKQLETSIELDMLQIEMLWRYLGLPV
ncbi:MAG TPA: hypothetical protein VK779_10940 [Rhizomicrobium sp.]|jgi:hypothetical protein|nr:hypothetical protein [Rhizomicrobium sp.]